MPETILVWDVGLTNCKTIIFSLDGKVLHCESVKYPTRHYNNGWMEQDPQDWWKAAHKGLKNTQKQNLEAVANISAISVTGHMHSLVCTSADGNALVPATVLGDRRAIYEAEEISAVMGMDKIYRITGARMDASIPVARLRWIHKNHPEISLKTHCFFTCKDWLRHQLTGDWFTDPVDACGTSLYELGSGTWNDEMIDLAGIYPTQLPEIREPGDVAGMLTVRAAKNMGLKSGIPVVVGAGDDVEILGFGVARAGIALEHLGTTGSILSCMENFWLDPQMAVEIYPHVIRGLWILGGSVTSAGSALQWVEKTLKRSPNSPEKAKVKHDNLIFLPHLAGERCPNWNPYVKGGWFGAGLEHTPSDLACAAREGVIFALREVKERIEALTGRLIQLRISMGVQDVSRWSQMRADIYGSELEIVDTSEPTGLGAMILATVGTGIFPDVVSAVASLVRVKGKVIPDEANTDWYRSKYHKYLDAGDTFRELYLKWIGKVQI